MEIRDISFLRFTVGEHRRPEGAIFRPLPKRAKTDPHLAKSFPTKLIDLGELEASSI